MRDRGRFHVYVIRLDEAVLEERRFRERNPHYREGKPCVYVGMTGLSPDERFDHHRSGHKASRFVRRYGEYLMRRQFEHLNPMTYDEAMATERRLARRLQRKGWAIWQA